MFREGRTTEHVKHRVDRFFPHPKEKVGLVGPLLKIEIQIKFKQLSGVKKNPLLPGVKKNPILPGVKKKPSNS